MTRADQPMTVMDGVSVPVLETQKLLTMISTAHGPGLRRNADR